MDEWSGRAVCTGGGSNDLCALRFKEHDVAVETELQEEKQANVAPEEKA